MSGSPHSKLDLLHQHLLSGKLPHDLDWNDAVGLVEKIGHVQPRAANEFTFAVGDQQELFRRPSSHRMGLADVSRLRKLLKDATPVLPPPSARPCTMVVAIDHHRAHLFSHSTEHARTVGLTITPSDPFGFHKHLIHRKEAHYSGDRVPEDTEFYEAVAQALSAAARIVLIGQGTGKSSAADFLMAFLRKHHLAIAGRVKGIEKLDLSALSEAELDAIATQQLGPTD